MFPLEYYLHVSSSVSRRQDDACWLHKVALQPDVSVLKKLEKSKAFAASNRISPRKEHNSSFGT